MSQLPKAKVTAMEVVVKKNRLESPPTRKRRSFQWIESPHQSFSQRLSRNLALASALLLCVAAVRMAKDEPGAQAVFQAIQEQVTLDLDETLGKLTFVSNMLPEASLVFWNADSAVPVLAPVQGDIRHVWSAAEPYISMTGASRDVRCGAAGEVMAVAHGENEELMVRIRHEDGLETLYSNLETCLVSTGDSVLAGDLIGQVGQSQEVFFELRQDGRSIDPTYLMKELEDAP